jgi:hypothetical protein
VKLVEIESPYTAPTEAGVRRHEAYARACLRDSLSRGEAPLASHLLYTQPGVLDDRVAAERLMGMEAGKAWGRFAELVAVYLDCGISDGMRWGIQRAASDGRPVEFRRLGGGWSL